jgi:hypothetical protein
MFVVKGGPPSFPSIYMRLDTLHWASCWIVQS